MGVPTNATNPTAQAAHPAYKEALVYEVRPAEEAREAPRCGGGICSNLNWRYLNFVII